MKIMTGVEDRNGEFECVVCGEAKQDETATEALVRVAAEHTKKKGRIQEAYGRLGPHDAPTSRLPALFVGRRGFFIMTKWNAEKREWELA